MEKKHIVITKNPFNDCAVLRQKLAEHIRKHDDTRIKLLADNPYIDRSLKDAEKIYEGCRIKLRTELNCKFISKE